MKKILTILAVTAITLSLSSVSYAGGDASPGTHKATTIEKAVISSHVIAYDLQTAPLLEPEIVQPQVDENFIAEKLYIISPNGPTTSVVNERCRTGEKNFIIYKKNISRSPGLHDAKRSQKFKDVHRRLCSIR